ncbi:MAG TPA: PQQ-binding-like beta-propeller repeat protein [Ktedonobacteraceae bacterium]|jgi:outer membrane protein assembly factor BamB
MTDPWPLLQQNPQHTARGLYPGPLQNQQTWSVSLPGTISGGVAVDSGGNLYVCTQDEILYCLNDRGATQWTYTSNYPFYGGPPLVGAGGVVYAGSNKVLALAPGGRVLWTYAWRDVGMIVSTPLTSANDGQAIYAVFSSLTGQPDQLVALRSSDGQALWEMKFAGHSQSPPAVGHDGTVYVGSDDQKLYALNPADGSLKWTYSAGGTIRSAPAIDEQGTIYIGRMTQAPDGSALLALKPDGSLLWSYSGQGYMGSTASPAIAADGTIYMGFYGLHAVTPTGQKKWATGTTDNVGIYPGYLALSTDGLIYVGTQDNKLYCYDAEGNRLWEGVGRDSCAPALVANGRLYATTADAVFAIQSNWRGSISLSLEREVYFWNQLHNGVYLRYTLQQPLPPGSYVLTFAQPGQPPDLRSTIPFEPRSGSGAVYLDASNPALPWSTTPARDGQAIWTILVGTVSGGVLSPYGSTTITLAPPAQVQSLVYTGSQVQASWAATTVSGASGYLLQVAASDGSYQTSLTLNTPAATTGALPVSLPDAGKTFLFTLCLLGAGYGRSCGAGVRLLVVRPRVTLVSYDLSAVSATWQPDSESGVASFLLKVNQSDGSHPQEVTIANPGATSGQIPLPAPLEETGTYLFTLWARKSVDGVSVQVYSQEVTLLVPAPHGVELFYDYLVHRLVAQWQAVVVPYLTVTGYHLELLQDGNVLVSQTTEQLSVVFAQDLVAGSIFQVRVQALGAGVAGPYAPLATAPFACDVTWTYDALSRLETMNMQGINTYTYTMDDAGNIETAVCGPSPEHR